MPVTLGDDGLLLDGEPWPLLTGSVQYWRLDPDRWPVILDRVAELGLRGVEVYMPWSAHERGQGAFDFTGRLDLARFLDLCTERELKVIARPGPHINAEITGFGFPERVLTNPALQARGPKGNPVFCPAPPRMFPVPTYAGEGLYEEFAPYLEALVPILRPRLYPRGPIVMLQPDNENTAFFRIAAFDLDYCAAAISDYRRFLGQKYGEVSKLNKRYGEKHAGFDRLRPPVRMEARRASDLPRYLDWLEYKERYLVRGVTRVAQMFREHELDSVPLLHNYPLGDLRSPIDLAGLEAEVDLVGMDLYYQRHDYRALKSRCAALCGTSRLPYTPEFGAGCYHAWPPLSLDDNAFTAQAAWMNGLRGFNFYMIVDRERWYGAPIRRDGTVDPARFDFYQRFAASDDRLRRARRVADTILLTTRLYGRLESLANVFDPLSPMVLGGLGIRPAAWCRPLELGLGQPLAADRLRLHEALFTALQAARLGFDLGEPSGPAARLSRYHLAVLPTQALLDHGDTVALLDFVRGGGTLVIGPAVPQLDGLGQRDRTLADALQGEGEPVPSLSGAQLHPLGAGRVVVLPEIEALIEQPAELTRVLGALGNLAGCRPLPDPGDDALDVAWHEGAGVSYLWLVNPTADAREAVIELPGAPPLEDVWTGESFVAATAPLRVPLGPYTIRAMQVGP